MSTKLKRRYFLAGRTVAGMANALKNYFDTVINTDVCVISSGPGHYTVECNTLLSPKVFGMDFGHDIKINITIIQDGCYADVHYLEKNNEILQIIKGIAISPWDIGIAQLLGVSSRRRIPYIVNQVISAYLSGTPLPDENSFRLMP